MPLPRIMIMIIGCRETGPDSEARRPGGLPQPWPGPGQGPEPPRLRRLSSRSTVMVHHDQCRRAAYPGPGRLARAGPSIMILGYSMSESASRCADHWHDAMMARPSRGSGAVARRSVAADIRYVPWYGVALSRGCLSAGPGPGGRA